MSDFGNINDVAALLHISVENVQRLMKRGTLLRDKHYVKKGRTPAVFTMSAVIAEFTPQATEKKESKHYQKEYKYQRFGRVIPMAKGYQVKL